MARRQYGNPYGSVTQVLAILRKIGLEMWFKNNTPQFINEESTRGKEVGKLIHEAIQSHIEQEKIRIETEYGEEVANALKSFMLFRKEHPKLKLKKAELAVTSEKHKFNGTLDCIGNDGRLVMFDWKGGTAKEKDKPPIYPEYRYQVAAYVVAYNEQKKANIQKAYILALAKDKVAYNLYEMGKQELQGAFAEVFLPALRIFNYQRGPTK